MAIKEAVLEATPTPAPAPDVTPAPETPDRPHGDPLAPEVPGATPDEPAEPEDSARLHHVAPPGTSQGVLTG